MLPPIIISYKPQCDIVCTHYYVVSGENKKRILNHMRNLNDIEVNCTPLDFRSTIVVFHDNKELDNAYHFSIYLTVFMAVLKYKLMLT